MADAFICDAIRTPFGRFGGGLASTRTDDLAAIPLKALLFRNPRIEIGDVIYGCVNQAGEDNRNVARMALLLAGLPPEVPGMTVNRLCGSSLEAVAVAARAIRCGDLEVVIAGGVESMSRAPFVTARESQQTEDTKLGWRFVNPEMKARYGVDSMAETAENLEVARADQDAFAFRSQQRAAKAQLCEELTPVGSVTKDEHPRPDTTLEKLAALKPVVRPQGTVTAGNASGINDGAAAILLASESASAKYGLKPRARVVSSAVAGVLPRVMGLGPVPASDKALARAGLSIGQMDIVELNEAFAAQALACLRALGLPDDAAHVNADGGAIALGHPLGASGARLVGTAVRQLHRGGGRYALCTMCIGVGQGMAMVLERV
jgi:3-oxoadipyl-CoA thiolase